jgi:hydroxymethylbilane synthase
MLPRADVCDRLVGADSIEALPECAVVGTSSPRRAAQLRKHRPDLRIIVFRGNVDTRLAKLAAGEADATLLAAAGLDRLGRHDVGTPIPINVMLPAPAQGAVGIECRAADAHARAMLAGIDDPGTHACVRAERALLAALKADCHSPVAALATIEGAIMTLRAELLSEDGSVHVTAQEAGAPTDRALPIAVARDLLVGAPEAIRRLFGG